MHGLLFLLRLKWQTMYLYDQGTVYLAGYLNKGYIYFEEEPILSLHQIPNVQREDYYNEKYRPQFHFTPESNWMNDPNGLVYFNGEYHLFYQYHPDSTTWGPMHWGHAVSKDLLHWEHLPVALAPDQNGMIFSGSAVVDWEDTTGFFNGEPGLVAIFTHSEEDGEANLTTQSQSLAYSKDNGRTWIKYKGNPVLSDSSIIDFRDPKVFWHDQSNHWVMVLAAGNCINIYASSNLINWTFSSSFGTREGSHQGVWECPDLFELPVDHDSKNKKWVMIVSIGDDPNYDEGSRTQYFIGDFNGHTFINNNLPDKILWVDYGRDNYAGVTWSDIPANDGRRIIIGWMSNWRYANQTPTEAWRSAMTIPRELSLQTTKQGVRLFQQPIAEIHKLRKMVTKVQSGLISGYQQVCDVGKGSTLEVDLSFERQNSSHIGLVLRTSEKEKTVIGFDDREKKIYIDRRHSGADHFHHDFGGIHSANFSPLDEMVEMKIFIDNSSIEVFCNDGEVVITDLIFPIGEIDHFEIFAEDGTVQLNHMNVYHLNSVWNPS